MWYNTYIVIDSGDENMIITEKDYEKLLASFGDISPQEKLVQTLAERDLKIATAESCTGGMISQKLTSVSGASRVFDCGVCSYANFIKEKVLGVSAQTLETVGAVSAETAEQMARGVRELAGADLGLSTTGIAGPTGGTAEKPVGLVYIGISSKEKTTSFRTELCTFESHNREKIRDMASNLAIILVLAENAIENT